MVKPESASPGPASRPARLSFKLQSPLFTMDALSPTFTISLSDTQALLAGATPERSQSRSLNPSTTTPSSRVVSTSKASLSPLPSVEDPPVTSKSTEVQNRMIDEQLEMLGQLFPQQMKKLSQKVDPQALETMVASMHDAPPLPIAEIPDSIDTSSDFQKSPDAGRSALSPEFPNLPDVENTELTSKRQSGESIDSGIGITSRPASPPEILPSLEKPLLQRRSLVANLRVDTVNSQQYATKELKLIRKMKDEGRMKSESKVSSLASSHPVREAHADTRSQATASKPPEQSTVDKSRLDTANEVKRQRSSPTLDTDGRAIRAASFQMSIADHSSHSNQLLADKASKANAKKHHRNSADSVMSHIVWSAVVEKFSEMAQEIAGSKGPTEGIADRLQPKPVAVKTTTLSSTRVDSPSSLEEDADKANLAPTEAFRATSNATGTAAGSPQDHYAAAALSDSPSSAKSVTQPTISVTDDASREGETPSSGTTAVQANGTAAKRRSKLLPFVSAMKKTASAISAGDGAVSDVPTAKVGKYNVIKLKRGRTVRVQSHHANVEGDYAAFLQEATSSHGKQDTDDQASKLSGKSNHSGKSAWSTKSGVENGCFRRGSMRSIKTGRTIATVGDVPIRDLSRHPNPFFSQQHGFRKIKAPHQDGPGLLRRKGSKIVRLSVFEGKSTQVDSDILSRKMKRGSDDGETLGSTLARMKDAKRKAPTPLIGELSFENDEPSKPRTRSRASPRSLHEQSTPHQAPLSSANLASYASTAIGISAKSAGDSSLAKMAYVASAYAAGSQARNGSSSGISPQAYPFPIMPTALPPVPTVAMRGFPLTGPPAAQLPPVPSAAGPSSSILSASRANVLAAQMRGAQMLGASQSNISLASNKSGSSLKRSGNRDGSSRQSPSTLGHNRKPSQGTPTRNPNTLPMSRIEDNFISMTPARSDMSIKSARSVDKDQWDQLAAQASTAGEKGTIPVPGSLPNQPALPEEMRATYRSKMAMRSSTAPLPPLPDSISNKPLPLRRSGESEVPAEARTSAHRPIRSLTVDTEAAKEQARRQMEAKMRQEQMQRAADNGTTERNSAATGRRPQDGNLGDLDRSKMPFAQVYRQSSQPSMGEPPRTGSSPFDKMAAHLFTPRRPTRQDPATQLQFREPRPPSAEPLDPALNNFDAKMAADRRDSKASNATSSTIGRSKGMNRIFGFGKSRKAN